MSSRGGPCLLCTSSRNLEPGHECWEQWHPSCNEERKGKKGAKTLFTREGHCGGRTRCHFLLLISTNFSDGVWCKYYLLIVLELDQGRRGTQMQWRSIESWGEKCTGPRWEVALVARVCGNSIWSHHDQIVDIFQTYFIQQNECSFKSTTTGSPYIDLTSNNIVNLLM